MKINQGSIVPTNGNHNGNDEISALMQLHCLCRFHKYFGFYTLFVWVSVCMLVRI